MLAISWSRIWGTLLAGVAALVTAEVLLRWKPGGSGKGLLRVGHIAEPYRSASAKATQSFFAAVAGLEAETRLVLAGHAREEKLEKAQRFADRARALWSEQKHREGFAKMASAVAVLASELKLLRKNSPKG